MWVRKTDLNTSNSDFGMLMNHGFQERLCQGLALLMKQGRNSLSQLTATSTTLLQILIAISSTKMSV